MVGLGGGMGKVSGVFLECSMCFLKMWLHTWIHLLIIYWSLFSVHVIISY